MGINEEIAKAFGAHGLWKTRIQQAIDSGSCEHSPDVVCRDDRCAFGKWLYSDMLPASVKTSQDYKSVRGLHADFHVAAGETLTKALAGDKQNAQNDLTQGVFAKASERLSAAMVDWQRNAATECSGYSSRTWRAVCFFWKSRISLRIWAAVAVPSLVAWLAVGYSDWREYQTVQDMSRLQHIVGLIGQTTAVIHDIQKERGLSAALTVKANDTLAADLKRQVQQTDAQRALLATRMDELARTTPAGVASRLRDGLASFAEIDRLRSQVGSVPAAQFIAAYSKAATALLSAAEEARELASSSKISVPIGALLELSQAKETAGIERAHGAAALSAGTPSEDTRFRLVELAALQDQMLARAARQVPTGQRAAVTTLLEAGDTPFHKMRQALRSGMSSDRPEVWFTAASTRIDRMRQIEEAVLADVVTTAATIESDAWRTMIWFNAAVLVTAMIGSIIVVALARGMTGPIRHLAKTMRLVAGGQTNIDIPAIERPDEIGEMARAVLVFEQQALMVEQMTADREQQREKAESERRRSLIEMAEAIEGKTSSVVAHVAAETMRLLHTAEEMAAGAKRVEENSQMVASAAEQSLSNAQAVSGASEELSASIREIASQVARSKQMVGQAVDAADQASTTVERLAEAMIAIDQVVQVIVRIAAQTNLLALNATIEAARAGEAGKGFAVVANEVKNLATRTGQEADDITRRIAQLNDMAHQVTDAIAATVDSIRHVDDIAGSVAEAVQQQNAATNEIACNVQQAAKAAHEVSERIGEVASEAGHTGEQAVVMETMMDAMADKVTELGHVLTQVVRTTAPEVDRRAEPRIAFEGKARVSCGHGEFEADLRDISLSGARVTGMQHGEAGETGVLKVDDVSVPITVIGRDKDTVRFRVNDQAVAQVERLLQQRRQRLAA